MTIDLLASGSSGNVATVHSGSTFFLIDCGMPFNWIMKHTNFQLPDAVLITHEHGDHAKAVNYFLKRQVDVFMTAGTAIALGLEPLHNLHYIEPLKTFNIGDVTIVPISSLHDAAEPVNFILKDNVDRVLFATDTGEAPYVNGDFTQIFIEANYSMDKIFYSPIDPKQKQRIEENHLSIEEARWFITQYPKADVTLLHLSERHADKKLFYKSIGREPK